MDHVRQTAGDVSIEAYTGGSPIWPTLRVYANNGEEHEICISVSHLHDLAYCVARVLAQIEPRR